MHYGIQFLLCKCAEIKQRNHSSLYFHDIMQKLYIKVIIYSGSDAGLPAKILFAMAKIIYNA